MLHCKRIIILAIMILLNLCASAQEYYLDGSVIDLENYEIHGKIDYRNWKYNPFNIKFIPDGSDLTLTYDPLTLKSFKIKNEKYISATVTVERTPDTYKELSGIKGRIIDTLHVFLKVLVEGDACLYSFNDKISGLHFYFRTNGNGVFNELEYFNAIKEIEGRREVVWEDEYKRQLNRLMSDCSLLKPLIPLADYKWKDLAELVIQYNDCIDAEVNYIAEFPSVKLEFNISAGLSAQYIDFFGSVSADLAAASFPVSMSPYAAIGLDAILPFARETFSVYNELGWHNYNTSASVLWYENEDEYENVDIDLGAKSIKLLTSFVYTYPAKKLKPCIYAGIVNCYAVSFVNDKHSVTHFYSSDTELFVPATTYRRYSQSLAAGLGLKYKKIKIDFRYERGNSISKSVSVNSYSNIFTALLHCSF